MDADIREFEHLKTPKLRAIDSRTRLLVGYLYSSAFIGVYRRLHYSRDFAFQK